MPASNVVIQALSTPAEMAAASAVFQQVWGTSATVAEIELMCAIAHGGGCIVGAYDSGTLVGASLGFLAMHNGENALHSHVTGVLPNVQHNGVGRLIKFHQRAWAAERQIPWITWTFDPLVRRNAWFNIEVLKAQITAYLVNFYGSMDDAINDGDESDRLVAAWPTSNAPSAHPRAGLETLEVRTPEDILTLRTNSPADAMQWRRRVRAELSGPLSLGAAVTGFTRDGSYVLSLPK